MGFDPLGEEKLGGVVGHIFAGDVDHGGGFDFGGGRSGLVAEGEGVDGEEKCGADCASCENG